MKSKAYDLAKVNDHWKKVCDLLLKIDDIFFEKYRILKRKVYGLAKVNYHWRKTYDLLLQIYDPQRFRLFKHNTEAIRSLVCEVYCIRSLERSFLSGMIVYIQY